MRKETKNHTIDCPGGPLCICGATAAGVVIGKVPRPVRVTVLVDKEVRYRKRLPRVSQA